MGLHEMLIWKAHISTHRLSFSRCTCLYAQTLTIFVKMPPFSRPEINFVPNKRHCSVSTILFRCCSEYLLKVTNTFCLASVADFGTIMEVYEFSQKTTIQKEINRKSLKSQAKIS